MKKKSKNTPIADDVVALLVESAAVYKEAYNLRIDALRIEEKAYNLILARAADILKVEITDICCNGRLCPGPLGMCVYEVEDGNMDHCLFCHLPNERK